MKLIDVATKRHFASNPPHIEECHDFEYGAARNAVYPELFFLLNARTANSLIDCRMLARDELELANQVLNRMDIDPHYEPSLVVLDAVRAINQKLTLCR